MREIGKFRRRMDKTPSRRQVWCEAFGRNATDGVLLVENVDPWDLQAVLLETTGPVYDWSML